MTAGNNCWKWSPQTTPRAALAEGREFKKESYELQIQCACSFKTLPMIPSKKSVRLTLGIKTGLLHLNSINELVFVDSGNGDGLLWFTKLGFNFDDLNWLILFTAECVFQTQKQLIMCYGGLRDEDGSKNKQNKEGNPITNKTRHRRKHNRLAFKLGSTEWYEWIWIHILGDCLLELVEHSVNLNMLIHSEIKQGFNQRLSELCTGLTLNLMLFFIFFY